MRNSFSNRMRKDSRRRSAVEPAERKEVRGRRSAVRLAEIGYERRNGYAWCGTWPAALLEKDYPA
jgi:hypothetical protein